VGFSSTGAGAFGVTSPYEIVSQLDIRKPELRA
jgi:hypothetical protein